MKRLIASLVAVAFLLTGSMMAANAGSGTPSKVSTSAHSSKMHKDKGHKQTGKTKPASSKHGKKPAKTNKPGKKSQGGK